jgi:plastocyanin
MGDLSEKTTGYIRVNVRCVWLKRVGCPGQPDDPRSMEAANEGAPKLDGGSMATHVQSGPSLRRGRMTRPLVPAALSLLFLAAACGGDDAGPGDGTPTPAASPTETATGSPTPTESPTGGEGEPVEVEAEDIAFQVSEITVAAGSQVTIEFNNRDDVPHNFAVYESEEAAEEIFSGEVLPGPAETTYTFQAPADPGDYFFRCDVHPDQMTGTLVVE